jgi:hypothetical protein
VHVAIPLPTILLPFFFWPTLKVMRRRGGLWFNYGTSRRRIHRLVLPWCGTKVHEVALVPLLLGV